MFRPLLTLQCVALALVLTWPMPARFLSEAVGSVEADGVKHLWTLWWMRAEALGGTPGLRTTLIDFPLGLDLYPIAPLDGLAALLLPIGPVPLSNLLALVHLVLLGCFSGWLGALVAERRAAGPVAAALAQGSAFAAFTLHVGVGELRQLWWVPLGLGCAVMARRTEAARWFLALALALVGATWACFYHGLFLAIAVGVYALATLRPSRRLLGGYLAVAVAVAACVLPAARAFSETYAPAEASASIGGGGDLPPATPPRGAFLDWMTARYALPTYAGAAVDPVELLVPRDNAGADRQTAAYAGGRYLGWTVLLLAALGVAAAPRRALPWVAVGAVGLVLSLGTVLWWDGALVGGGRRIVLPFATLNRALAWVAEPMNVPARFLALPSVALAVLGGLAAGRRGVRWLVPLALIEVAWGDRVPWPRATFALPRMDAAAAGELPAGGVADLTVFTRGAAPGWDAGGGTALLARLDPESRTRAIAAQIALDRPFSTVPVERLDQWGAAGLEWTSTLPLAASRPGVTDSPSSARASAAALRKAGFGAVLVTHACDRSAPFEAESLDRVFGPGRPMGCATVWPVAKVE